MGTSISERAKDFKSRETFGNWELDRVASSRGESKGCFAAFLDGSSVKRYDLPTDKKAMNENKVSLKEQLKLLFGNKAALLLSSAGLIIMIATSASNAVNMYYMSYNLNKIDLVAVFGLLTTLVSLLHLKKRKLK